MKTKERIEGLVPKEWFKRSDFTLCVGRFSKRLSEMCVRGHAAVVTPDDRENSELKPDLINPYHLNFQDDIFHQVIVFDVLSTLRYPRSFVEEIQRITTHTGQVLFIEKRAPLKELLQKGRFGNTERKHFLETHPFPAQAFHEPQEMKYGTLSTLANIIRQDVSEFKYWNVESLTAVPGRSIRLQEPSGSLTSVTCAIMDYVSGFAPHLLADTHTLLARFTS